MSHEDSALIWKWNYYPAGICPMLISYTPQIYPPLSFLKYRLAKNFS